MGVNDFFGKPLVSFALAGNLFSLNKITNINIYSPLLHLSPVSITPRAIAAASSRHNVITTTATRQGWFLYTGVFFGSESV